MITPRGWYDDDVPARRVVSKEVVAKIAALIEGGFITEARSEIDAQLPHPGSSDWLTTCRRVRRYLKRREKECLDGGHEFSAYAQLWMRVIKVYGVGSQRLPVSVINLKTLGPYDQVYRAVLLGLCSRHPLPPRRESDTADITAFLAYWDKHPVVLSALDALEMYQAHLEANPPL